MGTKSCYNPRVISGSASRCLRTPSADEDLDSLRCCCCCGRYKTSSLEFLLGPAMNYFGILKTTPKSTERVIVILC